MQLGKLGILINNRCLSLNARSICNKLGELHDLVRTKGVDVAAITETWLHQRIMETEILDSNYVIFRCDRQQGQRGGGVLLCLKSDFVSVRRRDLEMDEVEAVVFEISHINNSQNDYCSILPTTQYGLCINTECFEYFLQCSSNWNKQHFYFGRF